MGAEPYSGSRGNTCPRRRLLLPLHVLCVLLRASLCVCDAPASVAVTAEGELAKRLAAGEKHIVIGAHIRVSSHDGEHGVFNVTQATQSIRGNCGTAPDDDSRFGPGTTQTQCVIRGPLPLFDFGRGEYPGEEAEAGMMWWVSDLVLLATSMTTSAQASRAALIYQNIGKLWITRTVFDGNKVPNGRAFVTNEAVTANTNGPNPHLKTYMRGVFFINFEGTKMNGQAITIYGTDLALVGGSAIANNTMFGADFSNFNGVILLRQAGTTRTSRPSNLWLQSSYMFNNSKWSDRSVYASSTGADDVIHPGGVHIQGADHGIYTNLLELDVFEMSNERNFTDVHLPGEKDFDEVAFITEGSPEFVSIIEDQAQATGMQQHSISDVQPNQQDFNFRSIDLLQPDSPGNREHIIITVAIVVSVAMIVLAALAIVVTCRHKELKEMYWKGDEGRRGLTDPSVDEPLELEPLDEDNDITCQTIDILDSKSHQPREGEWTRPMSRRGSRVHSTASSDPSRWAFSFPSRSLEDSGVFVCAEDRVAQLEIEPMNGDAGADTRQMQLERLEVNLDSMHKEGEAFLGSFELRSAVNRRRGGQGLVQFARRLQDRMNVVVKFFMAPDAFHREEALCSQEIFRNVMPAVYRAESNSDYSIRRPKNDYVFPPFIISERGESLSEWVERVAPDYITSMFVVCHVAKRLQLLHDAGLIHGDIKPPNILWLPRMNAWKLMDFGCVAKEGEETRLEFTLNYAAPELISAWQREDKVYTASQKVDMWALGLVAYEMFAGSRVFPPDMANSAIIKSLGDDRDPLPWEEGGSASGVEKLGVMRKVILRCLSRNPAERPTSLELLEACNSVFDLSLSGTVSESTGVTRAAVEQKTAFHTAMEGSNTGAANAVMSGLENASTGGTGSHAVAKRATDRLNRVSSRRPPPYGNFQPDSIRSVGPPGSLVLASATADESSSVVPDMVMESPVEESSEGQTARSSRLMTHETSDESTPNSSILDGPLAMSTLVKTSTQTQYSTADHGRSSSLSTYYTGRSTLTTGTHVTGSHGGTGVINSTTKSAVSQSGVSTGASGTVIVHGSSKSGATNSSGPLGPSGTVIIHGSSKSMSGASAVSGTAGQHGSSRSTASGRSAMICQGSSKSGATGTTGTSTRFTNTVSPEECGFVPPEELYHTDPVAVHQAPEQLAAEQPGAPQPPGSPHPPQAAAS